MRIFKVRNVLKLLIMLVFAPTLCWAQAAVKGNLTPSTPLEIYQNAQRAAIEGRTEVAFDLLQVAAKRGVLGAQIEVARISAKGVGGPRDDAKAFYYYKIIADGYADIDRRHPLAQFIGEAFRMTANYLRNGIESAQVRPNPAEAAQLMFQAASYFRDRIAQYELAMMYLNAEGVEKNPKIAFTWLMNAARKRYAPAQAILGDMWWRGRDVKRSPAEGLAFLALAMDNSTLEERGIVAPYFDNALAEADNDSILRAEEVLKVLNDVFRIRSTEPPLRITIIQANGASPLPAPNAQTPDAAVKDSSVATIIGETLSKSKADPAATGLGFDSLSPK